MSTKNDAEGEQVLHEIMTEEEARAVFLQAIFATNHIEGGGQGGYTELLSFVLSWLEADHGDWAVSNVMEDLGWRKIE